MVRSRTGFFLKGTDGSIVAGDPSAEALKQLADQTGGSVVSESTGKVVYQADRLFTTSPEGEVTAGALPEESPE